jgi:hypothetical protein
MLLLLIRPLGQPRPRSESNERPNPPLSKPDGEQEQRSSAHNNKIQTNVRYHNIEQIYHLERRFFL